ncbi:MAG: diaminopimelate decarboxylase [Oscillospiraceae bacterium]|jgi:diaminopimelate decarboxylase|nr:diaminopimelate decarboxylase [Oscillospiraceae bacterium]
MYESLAKKFGTPLYVINENKIRNSCHKFRNALNENYGLNSLVLYASKAFLCIEMCKIINEENLGLDVVSGGEIFTAFKAGFSMEKIYFHGNNKNIDELKMALDLKVGRIVVDNYEEFKKIISLNRPCNILIRIKPNVDAHTHDSLNTGLEDSKFGFSMQESKSVILQILENQNINLMGFHCHIGSQIFEVNPFIEATNIMMDFIAEINSKLGFTTKELNLGGGFGVKYTKDQPELEINKFISEISKKIKTKSDQLKIKLPFICIEPGRSIIAEAGVTLYTVGTIKRTPNKIFVIVDGSMADNPRFALYKAKHEIINISRKNNIAEETVTIAGKCCESGDIIAENIKMPIPKVGDLLVVKCTGAYNFSMASNYNRLCRPAVVLIKENKDFKVIVRKQNYDDLIRCEIL